MAQGRKDLIHEVGLLDAHLRDGGPYVAGRKFTVADIPVGLVVNRWFMLDGMEKPTFEAVSEYYELLSDRPAFLAHGRNGLP